MRCFDKDNITSRVTILVVYPFEKVHIGQHHGQRLSSSLRTFNQACQMWQRVSTVVQSCQGIGHSRFEPGLQCCAQLICLPFAFEQGLQPKAGFFDGCVQHDQIIRPHIKSV